MTATHKLWNRHFTLWWLGSAQSAFGNALAGIALSFLVLEQTGSAGAMGVNLALALLPALLSPLAGTLVDRIPLKLPLVLGDVLRGLIVGGVGLWALAGEVPLLLIYTLSLLQGLIGTLYQPAAGALVPHLVPSDQLARANGLLGAAHQSASLLGLVGGGLLVTRFGNGPALIMDAVTFLVMAALLMFVAMPARVTRGARRSFWMDFRAGLARVRRSRVLMLVPVMAFFINASIAPMQMLLPKRMLELGAGAAGYGTFMGCMVTGMLLGSTGIAALGARFSSRAATGAGLSLIGLGVTLLATAQSPMTLWGFALLMGVGMGFTNTALPTLMQTLVEREYHGRVFSLLGMVGQIGMPIMLLALAPIADHVPLTLVFLTAGSVTLLASAVWAIWGSERPTTSRVLG